MRSTLLSRNAVIASESSPATSTWSCKVTCRRISLCTTEVRTHQDCNTTQSMCNKLCIEVLTQHQCCRTVMQARITIYSLPSSRAGPVCCTSRQSTHNIESTWHITTGLLVLSEQLFNRQIEICIVNDAWPVGPAWSNKDAKISVHRH